jgi:predicted TIM-barrel fold metal-dependent hydrolase
MVKQRSYTPPPASLQAYQSMLNTLGIERGVIVQPSFYGYDNRCTQDAVRDSAGAFRGVAVVPNDVSSSELAALHGEGFRGARVNLLFRGGSSLDGLEVLASRLAKLGWHLQFLLDISTLPSLRERLEALPCDVVFDHLGHFHPCGPGATEGFAALEQLLDNGRTWVKLSGGYRLSSQPTPFSDLRTFAQRLVQRRPDRLVWGSDWPHTAFEGDMPNDGALLDTLADWVPNDSTRHQILVDNPARLYEF